MKPSSRSTGKQTKRPEAEPMRVRLPGFLDEEIGLGDALKQVTRTLGVKPCGACEKRAATLNRWVVLSGRVR